MSDIVLSGGVRSNLLQLQQTSDLITQTQNRLATGKRVNSALDNPINYFTAQNLSGRANDLNSLLDSMSTAINTIQAANNGITAITKLVQSAQSIVTQAQQTTDTTIRATLASQFDSIRGQIDQLAQDSGINGINLLNGDALTTLRSQSQSLSSNLQTVQVRQDFTKSMINTLQTGADNLTLADSNEEGANLLALQTRQQLSTTALSLAVQSDRNVLRLFGG